MNRTLWVLQWLMGLFFAIASGAPKLFIPIDDLPMPIPIPGPVLVTIGVLEILGGVGMILPAITRVKVGLVPLAAAGCALVAIGGMAYQIAAGEYGNSIFALVFALICAFIAYGRWQLVPLSSNRPMAIAEPAS